MPATRSRCTIPRPIARAAPSARSVFFSASSPMRNMTSSRSPSLPAIDFAFTPTAPSTRATPRASPSGKTGWRRLSWPASRIARRDCGTRWSRRSSPFAATDRARTIAPSSWPRTTEPVASHRMIQIGIAGIGFMGMIHFLAARRLRDARVTAICSRDPKKRAGDWTSIRGNFGPPGTQMDLASVARHDSFEGLLADPAAELIDICTPTSQHADMAVAALRAGKHVLVEKPIALTTADADRMLRAARDHNRLLLVGHVLPFFPEFARLAAAVRCREYGRLLAGQFQRVIARPAWSAAIADVAQTGGPAIDLHIHDTHFIRMLCGMPDAVFATGLIENDAVVHINATYGYSGDGPSLACASGALCQRGRPFVPGYEVYFGPGTLVHVSAVIPPTLYGADGQSEQLKLPGGGDPVACFTAELQAAVNGIESGRPPPELDGNLARDALELCHRECESVRSGQIV